MTGYIRGGVTVLGAKREYPAYLDVSALPFDVIAVSAGVRGTQILLSGADYARAVHAKVGPLTR
jgi:Cys-tRNA(Pro)/Cys-tRNA(Cys) deacylase